MPHKTLKHYKYSSVHKPEWHDKHRYEADRSMLPVLCCRSFRSFERYADFVSRDVSENLKEIVRIEANINRIPCKANRQPSCASPRSGV